VIVCFYADQLKQHVACGGMLPFVAEADIEALHADDILAGRVPWTAAATGLPIINLQTETYQQFFRQLEAIDNIRQQAQDVVNFYTHWVEQLNLRRASLTSLLESSPDNSVSSFIMVGAPDERKSWDFAYRQSVRGRLVVVKQVLERTERLHRAASDFNTKVAAYTSRELVLNASRAVTSGKRRQAATIDDGELTSDDDMPDATSDDGGAEFQRALD
jgi:hypothetical protein